MIRSPEGDLLTPSTVFFEDDELLFGRAANQAAATVPQRAAEGAKRDFGQAAYSRAIEGQLLPVELIEGCLLKELCASLPSVLGAPPAAVLAVPAAFDQAQRRGVIDAARIAGLDVLGTITEPLATALAFAEAQGYLGPEASAKTGSRVLIFDLGGGKLDVAIVEIKPGRLRTLGVVGDARLGGRDWDVKLADYLADRFAKQFGDDPRYDMVSVRRLLASAEEAKHTLTARQQARVHVERRDSATDITVQRHAFEEATAELVERARKIAEEVVAQAGMAWRDVSHLLLVGGATRMPMIAGMVESVTGLKAANMHADEAVARGAAIHAARLLAAREGRAPAAPLEITNMTAHSVGMAWKEPGAQRAENVVLIPRGAELPCGTTSRLVTEHDDQASLDVQMLEGESREADQCRAIGRITIGGLPSELPAKSMIELHCQLTAEGRMQVKAQLPKGSHPLSIAVERGGGLNDTEMADWRRIVEGSLGLKAIHAQVAKHAVHHPEPEEMTAQPAAMPAVTTSDGPAASDAFELDISEESSTDRMTKSRSSSRKIIILLTGYVISAILGLAIGYYILLILRPELNVLHLPLPGLRLHSPRRHASPARWEQVARPLNGFH